MNIKFEACYISSNSNQTPTVVDWGKHNLVCYGAKNAVLIYDPQYGSGGKIILTLVAHSKRVNSVKWLSGHFDDDNQQIIELISGSADGTACVWTITTTSYSHVSLNGHSTEVNLVDGLYNSSNKKETVVVTGSMDSTVKIWKRKLLLDDFENTQTIQFGYHIAVGIRLYSIQNTNDLILGCCLDNSKINLYTEKLSMFFSAAVLSGHEDWVRGLDFINDGDDILMASCSQDSFIRIWRFSSKADISAMLVSDLIIKTTHKYYHVYGESTLTGHESWVYSVHWCSTNLELLSTSFDKTLIIWKYHADSGMWLETVRVGEVGGNTLGFYGGLFSPNGREILAHSYNGAFHIWTKSAKSDKWIPRVTIGGHFSEVVDCDWESNGEFLISVGADQTVRIHAPWKDQENEATWHEIARPQVHGYDMSSLAVISRYIFASAAEEKVIRIFKAPANFVENLRNICSTKEDEEGDFILKGAEADPKGAYLPSLGLSNKAVYSSTNNIDACLGEQNFSETHTTEPPTEELLLQNTLWPEIHKLYGHGYEVYSLDSSPDGKYLASACRSNKPASSSILLWNTSSWKQIQKLMSHTLTVVQLRFSPDSNHLLSVSRDRRWSLFTKSMNDTYELVATTDKNTSIHTRIIWTCAWSHDSLYFATGSRDGKLIIWTKNVSKNPTTVLGQYEAASTPIELKNESVTAVAFAPHLLTNEYLVAVGLECGVISLYKWLDGFEQVLTLCQSDAHHLTVNRLTFRKQPLLKDNKNTSMMQLASCGSDNFVRIYNFYFDE